MEKIKQVKTMIGMKSETIYQMYEDVKHIEVQQLRNKLHNWNDEFHFGNYHSDEQELQSEAPIVAASCYDDPTDVIVDAVIVLANDSIQIKCHGKNNPHEEYILNEDDVYYGHLDFVTSAIPNKFATYDEDKLTSLYLMAKYSKFENQRYEAKDYWLNAKDHKALKQRLEVVRRL